MARKVTLHINPAGNGNFQVVVNGEGFTGAAPNAQVGVRIRGEDTFFDDSLFTLRLGFPGRVERDGTFVMSDVVPSRMLDEDWGEDEIYALVTVQGFGEFRTNTVKGHF
jgi:hypothetical protein